MRKILFLILLLSSTFINAQDKISFVNSDNTELKIPIVSMKINNEKYHFIIDSGSNISIIDENWCKNKKFIENLGSVDMNIITINSGTKNIPYYAKLLINDMSFTFIATSIHFIKRAINDYHYKIIGILGSDFLRENKLIIDYKTNSIHK